MRRRFHCWTAATLAALVATGAGAQLLPAPPGSAPPVKKSATVLIKSVKSAPLAAPSLRPPPTADGAGNTVGVSPLLNAPLGAVRAQLGGTTLGTGTVSPRLGGSAPTTPRTPAFTLSLARLTTQIVPPTLAGATTLAAARAQRLSGLIQANPARLDRDDLGNPVVSGRLLAIDPDALSLQRARRSGFAVTDTLASGDLGFNVVVLRVPKGLGVRDALRRLKATAPRLDADYDHVFEPAGGSLGASAAKLSPAHISSARLIGMIDGGVAGHPSLTGRIAAQQGFAGPARATGHGTAVASLLIGQQGKFRGSANGASLLVADVYGGQSAAGSASAIASALGWLASKHPQVINISLVGPANALIRRAVGAVRARGIPIVAAIGNDGPAAPPQYPASYPGVIAVTAVDAQGTALFESGNSAHLDFAAPGADMAAARAGGGYVRVRGTSFAAPLAAGRLVTVGTMARLAAEAKPGKGRVGRGIVCLTCRVAPAAVGAR